MMMRDFRAALLAATSLFVLAAPAHAAAAEAAAADDQSTTANQAGQANDKQSLTSSDIIVTGSRTAEVAPVTASLTTTQPQAAVSREYIDNANAASDFNQLSAITTVSNVFNSRAITTISTGKTYGVDDQFSFLPPRSFLVDARVKI